MGLRIEKITLKEKIKLRMDKLQEHMENNIHLSDPGTVERQLASITKFWSVMSEEDQDYCSGARYALEEKIEWKI